MSSQPIQSTEPGYHAAVADETRSHDDVSSHSTLTSAYRQLVLDCLLMAPGLSGFTTVAELEAECDINADDLSLVRVAKGSHTSTVDDLKLALFLDVQAEWEIQNERRAQTRDEDFYGSSSPQTDRESWESFYGVSGLFR